MELGSTLSWDNAAANVQEKLSSRLAMLQRLSNSMPNMFLRIMCFSFIQPHIDYCLSVNGNTSNSNLNKFQRFQNRAAHIISHNYDYNISGDVIVTNLGWQIVSQRREQVLCRSLFSIMVLLSGTISIALFAMLTRSLILKYYIKDTISPIMLYKLISYVFIVSVYYVFLFLAFYIVYVFYHVLGPIENQRC